MAVIDLIAVAYLAPKETKDFLDSVISHVDVPFTLTIVENNSPGEPGDQLRDILMDGLEDLRSQNEYCEATVLQLNDENVGYARAVNSGVAGCADPAKIVGIFNCDIQFTDGTLRDVVGFFQEPDNYSVAVMGPRTTTSGGKLTHAGIFVNPVTKRDEHRQWLEIDNESVQDVADVPTVSGATYFTRRFVWDELTACPTYRKVAPTAEGAFLPTPHFYEETWYSYHARAHGYRVVYDGRIHMIHEWHKSSPVGSKTLDPAERQFREACAGHGILLEW